MAIDGAVELIELMAVCNKGQTNVRSRQGRRVRCVRARLRLQAITGDSVYVRVRGGKRQRPNGVYDSWASVRVGGWPGHRQGLAEREINIILILIILQCAPFVSCVPRKT